MKGNRLSKSLIVSKLKIKSIGIKYLSFFFPLHINQEERRRIPRKNTHLILFIFFDPRHEFDFTAVPNSCYPELEKKKYDIQGLKAYVERMFGIVRERKRGEKGNEVIRK